jgi:acyl-coenzyme A synthetase/AMP-(fatty) acid ligase
MKLNRVEDYERDRSGFAWDLPAHFNWASDVLDVWADSAVVGPALIAVNAAGQAARYSFAEISRRSCQWANLLRHHGVRQGDRVLVMLPRIAEWQLAMVACIRIGAVPIPCVTMLTERDLSYRISHSGAVGVVTSSAETHKFAGHETLSCRLVVGGDVSGWVNCAAADGQDVACAPAQVGIDEPAIMFYTSGSTGPPKAVTHASRALYVWRCSAQYWLSLDPGDVMWCTADTGWSKAGTSVLFGPWSRGATVLFYDGSFDRRGRFELLAAHRVVCYCASATELRQLVDVDLNGVDLGALRLTVSAGESVDPALLREWQARTGVVLLDGYGQTETLMTVVNCSGSELRPGSMGRPLPGVTAGVLTEDGVVEERAAAGQLVIAAPQPGLMLGYWHDEERTAACYRQIGSVLWFLTGDNVYIDGDGWLYFKGRNDDIIGSSGYRIGPQEVENALAEHPAVRECAVVGLPDSTRGEVVSAFVVLNPDYAPASTLAADLQEHVKRVTAPYKYPRRVEFVGDLPKTVSGKIRRGELRARYKAR